MNDKVSVNCRICTHTWCTGAHMVDADVITDGPITTGRALGAAMAFVLELVRLLTDEQTAARTAEEIVWRT